MRFLSPLVVLVLLAPSLAGANELSRVYGLALQNDTQLQAAVGARDAVVEGVTKARGALLPQVTGAGSYKKDKQTSDLSPPPPFPPGATGHSVSDNKSRSLSLNLRQALFDATAWNRWQEADKAAAAADATYGIAEQGLTLRVTTAYFDMLAAADTVRFTDAEKKAVERQLELAKKRFEVGLSAVTDVQEAQARFDLTVAQAIAADQALATARDALAEITGKSDGRIVPLKEDMPLVGPTPDNVNAWLKTAADNNLQVRLAQAQVDVAEQDVDVNRAGHYPTLSLVGSKSKGSSSGYVQNFGQNETQDTDDTIYGLELSVPIFSGLSTQAGVSAAKSVYRQRLAELDGAKRSVERSVRTAYQGVVTGIAQVKALKQAVVSNTTALEASEVGLEVGSRTAVDVLNAQQQLFGAQRDYSKSRYDYLLSILRLKQAAGVLTQKDLNEIDELLGSEAASEVAG